MDEDEDEDWRNTLGIWQGQCGVGWGGGVLGGPEESKIHFVQSHVPYKIKGNEE